MTKKEYEDEIIHKINNGVQKLGKELMDDKVTPAKDKTYQMDVLLDTMHFLSDYEENVKVLNDYWRNKRHQEKISRCSEEESK